MKQLLAKTEPALGVPPKDFPERGQLMEAIHGLGDGACEVLSQIMLDKGSALEVRCGAAWALGEMNDKRAAPSLMKLFGERPHALLDAAALALGKIEVPGLVPQLLTQYLAGEEKTNLWAGRALDKLTNPVYIKELLPLLKHKEQKVRATAASALGHIGDKNAVPGLVEALDDTNDGVVMFAAQALGQIGAPEALAPLNARFAKGGDVFVRRYVMDSIQAIRDKQGAAWATRQGIKPGKEGVPALITFLKDKDVAVRRSAAAELVQRDKDAAEAVGALVEALGDPDETVGKAAIEALVGIGAPAVEPLLAAVLKGTGESRSKGMATLYQLMAKRDPKTILAIRPFAKDLAGLLDEKDPLIAQAALTRLGMLGPDAEPAMPQILGKLADQKLGFLAALTLGGIGEKAVPDLLAALKNENKQVRAFAAFALGQIGVDGSRVMTLSIVFGGPLDAETMDTFRVGKNAADAVPALMGLLQDPDLVVRLMAVGSLGRMKKDAKAAVPLLKEAAKDKDPSLQKAAQQALNAILDVPEERAP